MENLATRIRLTRESLKITQGELAKRAGVSQGTIGNLESGFRKTAREIIAIANALGVSPEWLQNGSSTTDFFPHQAHDLSQWTIQNPTPELTWEDGLKAKEREILVWWAPAPDDAMSPLIRRGQLVECNTKLTPLPGDDVVVKFESDPRIGHLRKYEVNLDGSWRATPLNPHYPTIDSSMNGAYIYAVRTAIRRRGSDES